jgi:SAM-dependent methyltransferase
MIDPNKQSVFFDKKQNAYSQNKITKPPIHTQEEINQIISRLRKNTNKPTADFGAGSGRITIPLLKAGLNVAAIDVSKNSLSDLRFLANKLGLNKLKTTKGFSKKVAFSNIVGADILHHVDLDQIFPLLYDSLEEDGKIIFSEPSAFNPSWYLYLPLASSWSVEKGLINLRYYNIKNKLKKYGFKDIKISGLGFLPCPIFSFSRALCRINNSLGNLPFIKLFAYRYIIEAKK